MEPTIFSTPRIGNGHQVQHGDDTALIVQFYMQAVKQSAESAKAGRDIYKDEEYVWIRFAGDRTREVRRPVDHQGSNGHPPDSERWPRAWQAFKNSQTPVHEGTPLEQFPLLGTSAVLNFKAYNIHTVEQLAAVPDSVLHNLGTGAMDLREKAKVWLKSASEAALVTQQQEVIARQQADIDMLKSQIAELSKKAKKEAA